MTYEANASIFKRLPNGDPTCGNPLITQSPNPLMKHTEIVSKCLGGIDETVTLLLMLWHSGQTVPDNFLRTGHKASDKQTSL